MRPEVDMYPLSVSLHSHTCTSGVRVNSGTASIPSSAGSSRPAVASVEVVGMRVVVVPGRVVVAVRCVVCPVVMG